MSENCAYNTAGQRIKMTGTYTHATYWPRSSAQHITHSISGATAFTYDSNGNMITEGTNNYTWDSRNQLAVLSSPASTDFKYDAMGTVLLLADF